METRAEQRLPTPKEAIDIGKSIPNSSKKGHLPNILADSVKSHNKDYIVSLECIQKTGLPLDILRQWLGAEKCSTNSMWRKKEQQKFGPICIMENGNLKVTKPWRYIAIEIVKNNI